MIGFSILFRPEDESIRLLEYMAVEEGQRNGGVGAALFQHTVQEAGGAPMLPLAGRSEDDGDGGGPGRAGLTIG